MEGMIRRNANDWINDRLANQSDLGRTIGNECITGWCRGFSSCRKSLVSIWGGWAGWVVMCPWEHLGTCLLDTEIYTSNSRRAGQARREGCDVTGLPGCIRADFLELNRNTQSERVRKELYTKDNNSHLYALSSPLQPTHCGIFPHGTVRWKRTACRWNLHSPGLSQFLELSANSWEVSLRRQIFKEHLRGLLRDQTNPS